jgi:ribose 1,5-bisphosphokinase
MQPLGRSAPPIGPGRLFVVVGPSGAGKDTLLRLAQAHFRADPNVVFPRRVVTRKPSSAEDNAWIPDDAFATAVADGDFAFWWEAHGLKYALPATIDDDIRDGRTVVCNVSRAVVGELRDRYADLRVVLVTAPPDILAARLAARARDTESDIDERLGRAVPQEMRPDAVIENVGDPGAGAARLVAAIASVRV